MLMWIILSLYIAVIAVLGFMAYQKGVPTTEDYYLEGRSVSTFALAITMFATIASAFFYLGIAGAMAVHGVPFMAVGLWQFFTVLAMFYIGTRIWKLGKAFGYITPADLISHYYEDNKIIRFLVPLVFLMGAFSFMVLQMKGAGLSIEVLTDGQISSHTAMVVFSLIALAYVLAGGIRAVIWTDVFQGVYFGGIVLIIFFLTIFYIVPSAGIDNVWDSIANSKPEHLGFPGGKGAFGWGLLFSLVVVTGISNVGQPAVFQRFFMAKSAKTIRSAALLYAIIIVPLIYLLLYMTFAGIQVVTPPSPDMLFPTLLKEFAPVLAAFFIAGVIAAAMSTVDSLLISLSSMLTIDYAQKLLGFAPTQVQAVRIGRIFIVVVLVISYLLALRSPQMLATLALLQVGFAGCVLVPLVGVMMWKRASTAGAIAALVLGPTAVAVTAFWIKAPLGFNQNFWGPVIALVALVLVSLVTPAVKESHQAQFRQVLGRTSS